MPSASSLHGLMKFAARPEWKLEFHQVMAEHFAPACRKLGIQHEDFDAMLGHVQAMTLWGCAFEDFLARDLGDGRNVVDAYLKKRGYAENAGNTRYMRALRGAVMSLYELSDVVPGSSFLARDLIRGGEPVRVIERSASRMAKPWDRIAVRVVRLGDEYVMSGGVLLFEREAANNVLEALGHDASRGAAFEAKRAIMLGSPGAGRLQKLVDWPPPLARAAPVFTGMWLADALDKALNPRLPAVYNTDGEDVVACTITFPLRPKAKPPMCARHWLACRTWNARVRPSTTGCAPPSTSARCRSGPNRSESRTA